MTWGTTAWEAWRAAASARKATVSSVVIITLSLSILGLLGLVALALQKEAHEARRWITVEIFLSDSASTADIQQARVELVRMNGVLDAYVVSKQEAVERFRMFFEADLIDALETNPLPRSFLLDLTPEGRSPAAMRSLVEKAKQLPHVESVEADIEWITTLNRLVAGAAIVVILLLASVGIAVSIVISRTISLGIAARLGVIEVQRILGAPESMIRRPFILVGLCQGLIGGVFAGFAVVLVSHALGLVPLIGESMGGGVAGTAAIGIAAVGLALGWWGSRAALRTTLPPDPWVEAPERRRR